MKTSSFPMRMCRRWADDRERDGRDEVPALVEPGEVDHEHAIDMRLVVGVGNLLEFEPVDLHRAVVARRSGTCAHAALLRRATRKGHSHWPPVPPRNNLVCIVITDSSAMHRAGASWLGP
jgi:hypothetical protein